MEPNVESKKKYILEKELTIWAEAEDLVTLKIEYIAARCGKGEKLPCLEAK